jgi:diacylglycerol kinase
VAPPLNSVTEKDVEMYSSNLLPVATKAKTDHIEQLRYWKRGGISLTYDPDFSSASVFVSSIFIVIAVGSLPDK